MSALTVVDTDIALRPNQMRKGIREVRRRTRGNTYMAAGVVKDHLVVGCPPCDTVYLQFYRNGEEQLFIAITPEEAEIIAQLLETTVRVSGVKQ